MRTALGTVIVLSLGLAACEVTEGAYAPRDADPWSARTTNSISPGSERGSPSFADHDIFRTGKH
jgi:hypothetical protein